MRRFAILLVLVALCGSAADGWSQIGLDEDATDTYLRTPHRFQIMVDGGMAIPTAPTAFRDWSTTLPFEIGFGMSVLAWLDVNFVYSATSFSLNDLEAKRKIMFVGVSDSQGGTISTTRFLGKARFLAIPNQRLNPYAAVGVGVFTTTADDVVTEGEPPNSNTVVKFANSMDDAKGLALLFGIGVQYALNERWSAYSEFDWNINKDDSFAPSNLVKPRGAEPSTGDGSQNFATLVVGLLIRF